MVRLFEKKTSIKQGAWIPHALLKEYPGGASIRIKGYKCSACGFFRHYKQGVSNYCEDCGALMEKEETNGSENNY